MELARKIANKPPVTIKLLKLQTYKGLEMSLETALEFAADGEAMCASTQDHIEAVAAFLEKRTPEFKGK
jgi:enoyl-CoA hydratase/carnithine racemase